MTTTYIDALGDQLTDADKLRILADWHDAQDDKREFSGQREVQRDLRRMADALERQQAVVKQLREDMMDAVEGLGVRPMQYNGLNRAWLNQTNADVKTFDTKEECEAWCAETNQRLGTEGLEPTGNHISVQFERTQAMVEAAREEAEKQAADEGLWFDARYATEAHLQQALRKLHEIIEGKTSKQCALVALDAPPEGDGT